MHIQFEDEQMNQDHELIEWLNIVQGIWFAEGDRCIVSYESRHKILSHGKNDLIGKEDVFGSERASWTTWASPQRTDRGVIPGTWHVTVEKK